jgi:hypothetical protein
VLQGRVGSLEKKVGKLESTQFSTTTKLQGDTYWAIGGVGFGGNSGANQYNRATYGGMVFNYDLRLNFTTSFTGKDLLYTRLRSGNFSGSPFSGNPYNLMGLDRAYSCPTGNTGTCNNMVGLDRLYYRFPIQGSKSWTAFVGPQARNTEFLAINPSYYGDAEGLDYFRLHGAPGTYNKATGGMAGLMWKQSVKKGKPFFAASTSYVSPRSEFGTPGAPTAGSNISGGGNMTNYSGGSWLTQIGYQAQQWKTSFAWNYTQCGSSALARRGTQAASVSGGEICSSDIGGTNGGPANFASSGMTGAYQNSFALNLGWQPKKNGTAIPSIDLGWGYNAMSYTNLIYVNSTRNNTGGFGSSGNAATSAGTIAGNLNVSNIAATQSWTVALQWKDAFRKGNSLGMAVGQPTFVTSTRNGTTPFDGNYAWEWWYNYKVSDNISVAPILFYLSNPSSLGAGGVQPAGQTNPNVFGGLMTARFRF